MAHNKLPLINSAHGSETRNIINELIRLFNGMGYTYNESLQKAHEILDEAKKTNDMNKSVQNQINTLIAESGTSDAEVVQARIDSEGNEYDVLKTRLDKKDQDFKLSELYSSQFDFVRYVEENITDYDDIILKKENTAGWFQVICVKGDEHITHQFRPGGDGYIITAEIFRGAATFSEDFAEAKNAGNLEGNINTGIYPSYYAESVGDSFEATIQGEDIEFLHRMDSRGGVWEFSLNDGEEITTVSTYSSQAVTLNRTLIFRNLENKPHHIKAVFRGADINYSYDQSVRGWFYYNDTSQQNKTFVSKTANVTNSKDSVLASTSNREFAFEMRPEGRGNYQFVPIHSGTPGVAMINPPKILVNERTEVDTDSMSNDEQIKGIKEFKIIQNSYAKNDATTNNLSEITTVTRINSKGKVYITGKMTALQSIEISEGYGLMINANNPSRFISGIDNEYSTNLNDGSRTNLEEENDRISSGAFLSDNEPDIIMAIRFDDLRNSLRQNEDGKYPPGITYWIHHRSEFQKLYNSVFKNASLKSGDVYKWKGAYIVAEITSVNELI